MTNKNGRSDYERRDMEAEIIALYPRLRKIGLSLSKKVTLADDLVQETIFKALENWRSFTPGTNLEAWLNRIMRNQFYSDCRKKSRNVEWQPAFDKLIDTRDQSDECEAESAFDFNRILLFLLCLPMEQRDALVAVGYLGMTYEDASERLGCPVGTIKSRVSRAREALLRHIEESIVTSADTSQLMSATRGVPKDHPYYPIVKAYEELYASQSGTNNKRNGKIDKGEILWQNLVASGALEEDSENLQELMQEDWNYE